MTRPLLVPLWVFHVIAWPARILVEWRRQRDIEIIWPACKREAARRGFSLNFARLAFAAHAANDPAWTVLTDQEIRRRIDALT